MAKTAAEPPESEKYAPDKRFENAVHIVSQSKGGVGKSLVAKCLAEFCINTGRHPLCFDADPSNQTFAHISVLDVTVLDLVEDGEIKRRNFDELVEAAASNVGPFVIDTGSSSFHAFWSYVAKHQLFDVLAGLERPIVAHIPIAPAPDLDDTLLGFDQICRFVPDSSVIVWLNERTEPIVVEGKSFTEWPMSEQHAGKVIGSALIRYRAPDFHGADLVNMLKQHLTFNQAIEQGRVMQKARLWQIRKDIFDQLELLGI